MKLDIEGLTVEYGQVAAVRGLNLTVGHGELVALVGPSGCGKTTTLGFITGFIRPKSGRVLFDGVDVTSMAPQRRGIGYVFQDYILFPHLNVFENVAFGLRAQHLPHHVIRRRVGEALEQVHLPGLDQRRATQLSGGQQQRVAIARALALQPQLLLLDEPLAALDIQTRREVRQELRHILVNIGITTILVTHQYLEALLFGQSILVLDAGRIIQQGSQHDLLLYPRSSYVAELVGMNFFRGRVVRNEANSLCTIQLQQENHPIEVMAALEEHLQGSKTPAVGEEAFVVVDPRSITLYQKPPDSSARNVFGGEIVQVLRLDTSIGKEERHDGRVRVSILLNTSIPPLTAEITGASAARMELSEGKTVYASFKATEARAYT